MFEQIWKFCHTKGSQGSLWDGEGKWWKSDRRKKMKTWEVEKEGENGGLEGREGRKKVMKVY